MRVAYFDRDNLFVPYADMSWFGHTFVHFPVLLDANTKHLCNGFDAVSIFVNDCIDSETANYLVDIGCRTVFTRSIGVDHIYPHPGLRIFPSSYPPDSVAEHTVLLLLALSKRLPEYLFNVSANDYRLTLSQDLSRQTVGILGWGSIGRKVGQILKGFGCQVLFHSRSDSNCRISDLYQQSDVITLHLPSTDDTRHILRTHLLKPGCLVVNTSRADLIDYDRLIDSDCGGLALDCWPNETHFYRSHDISYPFPYFDLYARLKSRFGHRFILTPHCSFYSIDNCHAILTQQPIPIAA